jgi:hypothetical protein
MLQKLTFPANAPLIRHAAYDSAGLDQIMPVSSRRSKLAGSAHLQYLPAGFLKLDDDLAHRIDDTGRESLRSPMMDFGVVDLPPISDTSPFATSNETDRSARLSPQNRTADPSWVRHVGK